MQKFKEKSTAEVYDEYVKNCVSCGVDPLNKVAFCREFLRENPEYRVMVKKPDGKKSVKFFVLGEQKMREKVSTHIWDEEFW